MATGHAGAGEESKCPRQTWPTKEGGKSESVRSGEKRKER